MKTRDEKIESFLLEPIKVGDKVYVKGLGTQDKTKFFNSYNIDSINEDESIFVKHFNSLVKVEKGDYKKYTDHVGYNPFPEKNWLEGLRIIQYNLESVIGSFYDIRNNIFRHETISGIIVNELEWEPFFINENEEEVVYQRDFCWNLNDKQLLIDSIYNGIDIGKIIVRRRSWNWVESRIKQNKKAAFRDIVDGKQRLKTILEFLNNEFSDSNGFYWNDLSRVAQIKFLNFQAVSYGEIEERVKDEDVKKIFLNVNFSGVAMSQEHIDFVRNINI
jgi:hypothetical protein